MPEPSSARQTQGSRRAPVSFRCDELWEEFVLHRLEDVSRLLSSGQNCVLPFVCGGLEGLCPGPLVLTFDLQRRLFLPSSWLSGDVEEGRGGGLANVREEQRCC